MVEFALFPTSSIKRRPCDNLPSLADVVLRLVDVSEQVTVPYAIGGAVAASFWGVPCTTQDADCLVADPAVGYPRLADALNARGFEMEESSGPQPVRVAALLEQVRRDTYMTLLCRVTSVELFVPVVPLQQSILRLAVGRTFNGRTIRVTSAEDSILLKMELHSQKDLQATKGILYIRRGHLDMPYLRQRRLDPQPTLKDLAGLPRTVPARRRAP